MRYQTPIHHSTEDPFSVRSGESIQIVDGIFDHGVYDHDVNYAVMLAEHTPLPEPRDQLYTEVGYQSSQANTVVAARRVNSKWRYLLLAPGVISMLNNAMRNSNLQRNTWYGFRVVPTPLLEQNAE